NSGTGEPPTLSYDCPVLFCAKDEDLYSGLRVEDIGIKYKSFILVDVHCDTEKIKSFANDSAYLGRVLTHSSREHESIQTFQNSRHSSDGNSQAMDVEIESQRRSFVSCMHCGQNVAHVA